MGLVRLQPTFGLRELIDSLQTNLVERPSAEVIIPTYLLHSAANRRRPQAAELSPAEMVEAVPAFLSKVSKYRPRIVCFVGMGIWRTVEKALVKLMASTPDTGTSLVVSPAQSKGNRKANTAAVGIQPYRLLHDIEHHHPTGKFQSLVYQPFCDELR